MKIDSKRPELIFEEKKAIKLFLWIFLVTYIIYDLYWYLFIPAYTHAKTIKFPDGGFGYWRYFLIFFMLVISIFLIKKDKIFGVKYFILISYFSIDFLDTFLKYFHTSKEFASGHIVELFFVLFAPIFVNKKYFWITSLVVILKYFLLGVTLHTKMVIFPIVLIIVISGISYFLLMRFCSYIVSLTSVYEELKKKEKLAVVGQMAAAIGHEIRNPLSSLKGFTQFQHEQYPNTNDFYPIMIDEIDRIDSIVTDLMYIGKPKALMIEKTSIQEIITYTVSVSKQHADRQGISIEVKLDDQVPLIDGDEKRLKQVFINLIKNAIEAMPDGGKIKIKVHLFQGNQICISIEDDGCGIEKENIKSLGEPFFSTKTDGTGLGLMVTKQIIMDHNGSFKIQSEIGKGTKVDVILSIINKQ
ncbi:ATP-binding protein [Bacillus sp. BRMEA1]|uniref:ATP-binding protein n=1 Tax=Neobacillus endophyticus TaxID=2738405 RepID=UPI001563969B|nr:ATP-binding protein [Neobacillus endophyticus]NRD78033.1 ATP-binding protein [Neobacillus endophyticus]